MGDSSPRLALVGQCNIQGTTWLVSLSPHGDNLATPYATARNLASCAFAGIAAPGLQTLEKTMFGVSTVMCAMGLPREMKYNVVFTVHAGGEL